MHRDVRDRRNNGETSMVSRAYRKCPHCKGETRCNCSTCGQLIPRFTYTNVYDYGMCQVCRGLGEVPDPDYDPNKDPRRPS